MAPPPKRRKTATAVIFAEDDDDELSLEPDELNQQRDPAYQLQKGRALAVNKLKSIFEDIFAKYERDFTGVADEIDLRTGEVVVDNGHLESMTMPQDSDDDEDGEDDEGGEVSEDKQRALQQSKSFNANSTNTAPVLLGRDPRQVSDSRWPSNAIGNAPRVPSMMFSGHQSSMSPFMSTPPFGVSTPMNLDPAWQAPELPVSSFGHGSHGKGRQHGQKVWSTTRNLMKRHLPSPEIHQADEEDVLLGVSGNVRKMIDSPLIKAKFPTISSPQEDPDLTQFIQEVIQENLPASSPSNRIKNTPRLRAPPPPKPSKQERPTNSTSGSKEKGPPARPKKPRAPSRTKARKPAFVKNKTRPGSSLGKEEALKKRQALDNEQSRIDRFDAGLSEPVEPRHTPNSSQRIFVEIKVAKVDSSFVSVPEEMDISKEADKKESESAPTKATVQGVMERNVVDPSFNFSDDEALLPKKARTRRQTGPITAATAESISADTSNPKSQSTEQPLERNTVDPAFAFSDEENTPPRGSRCKSPLSEWGPPVEAIKKTSSKAATDTPRALKIGPRKPRETKEKETKRDQAQELPLTSPDSALSITHADAPIEIYAQSESPAPEKPTSSSPLPEQPQQEPTTPHKQLPTENSLISLLSDNEDEEDEISFHLADFTPSGRHRILVHRPLLGLSNPRLSLSALPSRVVSETKNKKTKIKKKRHSSFVPSSSSSSTRTPHHTSKSGKKHRHNLPQSVVKVQSRRHQDRLPSPTGSIIQTPGGTKRRCGDGDFRCERDFCFVCM